MSSTVLFPPSILPTTDVQATTLWGRAFDWLMVKHKLSLGQFSHLIARQRNEVRYWRLGKGNFGPGVGVLNEILPKIDSSWVEWAGILTQLNIIDERNKVSSNQSGNELLEDSFSNAECIPIPKELEVHSRTENDRWVAWMKAFPQWKLVRDSQQEAEAAMRVLAIQIIRLVASFEVDMSQGFQRILEQQGSRKRQRRGKLVRPA